MKKGSDLVKRKPKNARAKRALLAREPKVVENPKSSIMLRGMSSSQIVNDVLSDLHKLRVPLSKCLTKKTDCLPFENNASVEFLCQKNDASLFVMGSHTKKRPHNLVFGRTYDGHVLDMLEFGVENYKGIDTFKGVEQPMAGSKPCLYFGGNEWENSETLQITKNLLIDLFRGMLLHWCVASYLCAQHKCDVDLRSLCDALSCASLSCLNGAELIAFQVLRRNKLI